jgi:thiol-disulfide isomerase/thioredoxin
MACVSAKPIVDGIANDYAGRVRLVRIDARDSANRELADQLGLRMTPTYVIYDAQANEVYRTSGSMQRTVFDQVIAGMQ